MSGAYSPLKIFHHQGRLQSLQRGLHPAPIHVQLIPTNRCNQACKGCAYRMDGYTSNETFSDGDQIPWEKLQGIVADCRHMGVKAIELTGGGEPTVHPQFLELCDRVLSSGIKLGVVTNGARWSPEHTATLAKASWVRFSIDAGNAQSYASYRKSRPEVYEQVRENIRSLASADRIAESLIGVGFVLHEDNWPEVVAAADAALADGADNFRISALFQSQGAEYFRDFYEQAVALCKRAVLRGDASFRVFNLFGDRIEDLREASPSYRTCNYSKLTTYLGADQNAYTCCIHAYSKAGLLGSFKEQPFMELWNSQAVRDKLCHLDARECVRCMYNEKNNIIAYAMADKPEHSEFV